MQENYAFIADAIDARCRTLTDIADAIWDRPETRFEEFWSAERLASELEAEGFTLTREAGGIPNAFIASFGSGNVARRNFSHRNALNYAPQQTSKKPLLRTVQIKTPRSLSHSNDEAGNLR